MENSYENITESNIVAYLNGEELSDVVCEEIAVWLQSPENQREARQIYQLWELSAMADPVEVDIEAALKKIQKRTGLREAKTVSFRKWWMAAAASILIILAFVWHLQPDENTVTIASFNQQKIQTLNDQSTITLNQNSSIIYQPDLLTEAGKPREITLSGECYFEVAPDSDKPFIVQTNDIRVRVLGTKFMVKTFEDKPSSVIVTEGKVKVDHLNTGKSYLLEAKESIDFSEKTGPVVKASDENKLYWKTGVLTFNGKTMQEVIGVLESEFDVEIAVEKDELLDCSISVTLKRKSIDTIIEVITTTFGWESERNGDQILLKGNGCQ